MVCLCLCTIVTSYGVPPISQHIDGQLAHISVGQAGVWGVGSNGEVWQKRETYNNDGDKGERWRLVGGTFKQVDAGTDIVWGVGSDGGIYIRLGITHSKPEGCSWEQIQGSLDHVSVSKKGHVWGVGSNRVWIRVGASIAKPEGVRWQEIVGEMKIVSVGESGVWGVNSFNKSYYRSGTLGDVDTTGQAWIEMDGEFQYITSGRGGVWAVTSDGDIFYRQGISQANPAGIGWGLYEGTLKQLDVGDNAVWGVAFNGNVMAHIAYT